MPAPPRDFPGPDAAARCEPTTPPRLWFLDWLRIIALLVLVLYHVGMLYVRWDFHVKSPHASAALEPWMRLSEPWRMSLLFLVSGAATALMWRGVATGTLLRRRSRQLLLPLLCGMVLVVPPQAYFQVAEKFAYTGSYLDFLGLYFSGYRGFCSAGKCLILPTWNHLWFLPYLWLYTALLAAAVALWPGTLAVLSRGVARVFATRSGLLLAPIAVLALLRWGLYARYPQTYALWGDGYAHPLFGGMFVLGVALGGAPQLWPRLAALRWAGLALALLAWALLVFGLPGSRPLGGVWRPIGIAVQQWGAMVAAVGFAHRYLNRDHPLRHWLTRAVFPVYVLHQTVLIALSRWLRPLDLPPLSEGLLIACLTLALCLLAYRWVLLPWPRLYPWFGVGAAPASAAVAPR